MELGRLWQAWEREGGLKPRFARSRLPAPEAARLGAFRLADLAGSGAGDLAFFFSLDFREDLARARPGVLVTGEAFVAGLEGAAPPAWTEAQAVIALGDPALGLALATREDAAGRSGGAHLPCPGKAAEIHPGAFVHPDAVIGAGVVLYPGVYVGARSRVGAGSVLFPNVVVYEDCALGERVRVHANSTIGADGFGYALQREPRPRHHKIYHLGTVEIGDDVEIGANACVDRGTLGPTRIGAGAKLDNQVHVGHNAEVGAGAILCGGTCLAGHARVREFAFVGGLAGISNQVTVGAGARIGALSLIAKDVPPGAAWVGNPAREHGHHFKIQAMLNRLLKQKKKGSEA